MVAERRQSDIVEQAFEALRAAQLPDGPSLEALEQTLQAVHQAHQKPTRVSLMERIKNMNKLIKYPIAASFALAMLAGAAYLLLGPHAGIAFADVREQIEQVRTMTVTGTAEMNIMDPPMTVKMKMYCKSPGLMRQEMETTMPMPPIATTLRGAAQPATSPAAPKVMKVKTINIFDIPNQKALALSPAEKMAMVFEFKNMPAEVLANAKDQNFLDELKKAIAGEHEELGEKTIDGRKVKGYRCKNEAKMTMDIWADATTGRPILVEQALPQGMGKVTMTDFVLNPVLDDSLFDTKVPEGYRTETQTFDFKVQDSDLPKGLGLFAKYCGGVFPKTLLPTPELIQQLEKAKISPEESKEFSTCLSKLVSFQVVTMQSGEFVYAGEGVKLGDKATPILWYKAKDAKTYRVIYGDLRVEDAPTAPKQRASQPATESR